MTSKALHAAASLNRREFSALGPAALLRRAAAAQSGAAAFIARAIPSTGERLPAVGLGTARVLNGDDEQTRRAAAQVLQALVGGGGRLVDTGSTYGNAESVLGSVIAAEDLRDKVFLATKLEAPDAAELQRSLGRLKMAKVDLLQLHKPESLAGLAAIGLPSLLPVRVAPDEDPEALHRHAIDAANGVAEYVLMDGYHPELAGGTGVRADWDVARSLAEQVPLLLAGGLNPGNIAEAIAAVRPAGVDVAGGVERDGEKSPDLIRAFIANARAAFAQSSSSGTSSQDAP